MADGGVIVMKPGNAGGAKAPCSDANVQSGTSPGTGASLIAPLDSVRTLQSTLQAKAKSEATARFYSLWDKVCREDVLVEAYRKCRANRGAPGVDGESFDAIEAAGLASWLQRLRQELCTKQYRCGPLLIWLRRRSGKRGTGYRQYPDQYLYEKLGLIRLLPPARDRSNAKA